MAVSNGLGNGAVSHLDRLLSEKPPEFQAKVLRFALDSGMKQDDPAFRLVQYIGYLAQLTETAPNDWKLLFENLQDELNEWSQLTAEQLKIQADHTENIQLQSARDSLERIKSNVSATTQAINELNQTLREFEQYLPKATREIEPTVARTIERDSDGNISVEPKRRGIGR
jgi:multidrug efflux pump subunit AcrA (membrane-fusion protein)